MINKSHFGHAAMALVIQLALAPLIGLLAGGLVAVSLYLGREIAQHEYRLGIERGWQWGETLPVRWYEGLTHGWHRDSILDFLSPAAICAAAALAGAQL